MGVREKGALRPYNHPMVQDDAFCDGSLQRKDTAYPSETSNKIIRSNGDQNRQIYIFANFAVSAVTNGETWVSANVTHPISFAPEPLPDGQQLSVAWGGAGHSSKAQCL